MSEFYLFFIDVKINIFLLQRSSDKQLYRATTRILNIFKYICDSPKKITRGFEQFKLIVHFDTFPFSADDLLLAM